MNFSAILDISSFFIGMIINLLLIALICYYFKRKYENLEIAQNEQAKVLYQLLQQNSSPKVMNLNDILKDSDKKSSLSDLDSDDSESDSGSESDSDEDSEIISEMKSADKIKTISLINLDKNEVEMEEIQVEKVEMEESKINVDELEDLEKDVEKDLDKDHEKDYSKMSIKQLKEILSVKGIVPTKMKKNEMIELIEKSSVTIDENE